MTVAFDSSALLAIVKQEPGADLALQHLQEGVASAVIFAETLGKVGLAGRSPGTIAAELRRAGLEIDPVDEADALAVAALHELARKGISLADRFCLAHGITRKLPILTTDRAWAALGLPVELRFIR